LAKDNVSDHPFGGLVANGGADLRIHRLSDRPARAAHTSYVERARRAIPFQLLARDAAASDPAAAAVWEQMLRERLTG
jgi:hypothetical protein